MGQRLVISVYKREADHDHDHDNCFAKIYYHWSGYTVTAFLEVGKLMEDFPKNQKLSDSELAQYFVRQLEKQGGGLDPEDTTYYTELTGDSDYSRTVHRNNGLIAFSNEQQQESQRWSEADAFVYLEEFTFDAGIGFPIFDLEKYCNNYKLNYEETKNHIESNALKFDIDRNHSIDDAFEISKKLNDVDFVITSDNIIFECVC